MGFYNDAKGNAHGYTYNIGQPPYGTSTSPAPRARPPPAINNGGDIAGFDTDAAGTVGLPAPQQRHHITLNVPGSSMTQAFGVNDGDAVVGAYQVGTGRRDAHGFVWAPGPRVPQRRRPQRRRLDLINGINDHGRVVGFYTDSAGNTDGFLATPQD